MKGKKIEAMGVAGTPGSGEQGTSRTWRRFTMNTNRRKVKFVKLTQRAHIPSVSQVYPSFLPSAANSAGQGPLVG
jgi:hypothetical protein